MSNFSTSAARSLIGIAGALLLSLGVFAVTVAPAITVSPLASLSA